MVEAHPGIAQSVNNLTETIIEAPRRAPKAQREPKKETKRMGAEEKLKKAVRAR